MVELEDFKYGGTNISALRIVDPENETVLNVVQDWVKGEMRFNRKIPFSGKTIRVSHLTLV
jgi:ionotropic glutamate receptor